MKKNCTLVAAIIAAVICGSFHQAAAQWSLTGNAGTTVTTNFVGTTDAKGLVFRTNNVERMRLTSNGNLGLGTVTADSRFSVVGTSGTSLTSPGYIMSGPASGLNLSLDNNELQARNDSAGSTLYLNYWGGNVWMGSTGLTPVIYAASDGTTGLKGTNDPNYLLKLNTPGAKGGILIDDVTSGTYPSLSASKSDLGTVILAIKSATGSAASCLQANSAGTGSAVYASSTGSDGIGVTAFSSNGNGLFADGGSGTGDYAAYFSGSTFSTGSYLGSDKKLKTNIRDFSDAMSIIEKLQPKTYEYRHDENYGLMKLPAGQRYGLIAQDVEQVLPGIVKESSFKTQWVNQQAFTDAETQGKLMPKSQTIDFKAVNYTELIPIMIKGMQEQQQVIDKQQQVNEQLQVEIADLKKMVQALAQTTGMNTTSAIAPQGTAFGVLSQNAPNPFRSDTKIQCNIPASAKSAVLVISALDGRQLQSHSINSTGVAQVIIHGGTLPAGNYLYTLKVDNKLVDTKQMTLTR